MPKNDNFLRACRRQPVDHTPIWLMRQAGRYMPEYRAVREHHSFMEMIKTPEIARDVTMQPIEAFGMDAAILYADILPPLEAMGLELEFIPGQGPVIHNPVSGLSDIAALETGDIADRLWFTFEGIRMTLDALSDEIPLIGFTGAPFTLACYAIEGKGSKNYDNVKKFMYQNQSDWHRLMEKLTEVITAYVREQVATGVQAFQIFDSWIGILSPADFKGFVQPYLQRIIQDSGIRDHDVPLIYFGTGTSGMFSEIHELGTDVVGVDWRIDLDKAWDMIGDDRAVQGNFDPLLLFGGVADIEANASRILDSVNGRDGHIFNLGHGILQHTPVENVRHLVEFVQGYRA